MSAVLFTPVSVRSLCDRPRKGLFRSGPGLAQCRGGDVYRAAGCKMSRTDEERRDVSQRRSKRRRKLAKTMVKATMARKVSRASLMWPVNHQRRPSAQEERRRSSRWLQPPRRQARTLCHPELSHRRRRPRSCGEGRRKRMRSAGRSASASGNCARSSGGKSSSRSLRRSAGCAAESRSAARGRRQSARSKRSCWRPPTMGTWRW